MALSAAEVARVAEFISTVAEIRNKLRDWDRQFHENIEKAYDELGSNMRLTAKQWAQIERIQALA